MSRPSYDQKPQYDQEPSYDEEPLPGPCGGACEGCSLGCGGAGAGFGGGSLAKMLGAGGAGGFLFFLQLGLFIFHLAALVVEGDNRIDGDIPGAMTILDDNIKPDDFKCLQVLVGDEMKWRTEADENIEDLFNLMVILVVIDGLMLFGLGCLSAGACCVFGACCLSDGTSKCDARCMKCWNSSSAILMAALYIAQFVITAIVTAFWVELSQNCRSRMAFEIHYYYDSIAFRSIFFLVAGVIILLALFGGLLSCCMAMFCPECCGSQEVHEEPVEEGRVTGYETRKEMVPPQQGGGGYAAAAPRPATAGYAAQPTPGYAAQPPQQGGGGYGLAAPQPVNGGYALAAPQPVNGGYGAQPPQGYQPRGSLY